MRPTVGLFYSRDGLYLLIAYVMNRSWLLTVCRRKVRNIRSAFDTTPDISRMITLYLAMGK